MGMFEGLFNVQAIGIGAYARLLVFQKIYSGLGEIAECPEFTSRASFDDPGRWNQAVGGSGLGGTSSEKTNLPNLPVVETTPFECYRVILEIFESIIRKFGTERPTVDLFADRTNSLYEKILTF